MTDRLTEAEICEGMEMNVGRLKQWVHKVTIPNTDKRHIKMWNIAALW
jgi:hypothetical protein